MNWAGKHMASSKMKKKNKIASDDAERAERLAERCVALLKALPMGRSRDPDDDGPWDNWYEKHPGHELTLLKQFIDGYFRVQRISRQPDDSPRQRKDFDDMHKAAIKFAASIRRVGVRDLDMMSLDDPDPPNFEALFAKLESATRWMKNNPSKHLLPSLHRHMKGSARRFVAGVIYVVEGYTGNMIKRNTKGSPTAEMRVLEDIVATVDPTIRSGTITEALKYMASSGFNPSGRSGGRTRNWLPSKQPSGDDTTQITRRERLSAAYRPRNMRLAARTEQEWEI
jgi:hypothetical protein